MTRRLTVTLLAPFLGGCFTYIPVDTDSVDPGVAVRARVTPDASDRIAPLLGASSARLLTGTLISSGADGFVVEVPIVLHDTREFGRTPNQRVSIRRPDLLELEIRRLDRVRTIAFVGGAAVLVVGSLIKALRGEPGKEPLPGGGGTDALVPVGRGWP